jgi:hypothetical protein
MLRRVELSPIVLLLIELVAGVSPRIFILDWTGEIEESDDFAEIS